MLSAKDWVLGGGVAIAALGLMCLPIGEQAGPKRTLSIFTRAVDAGAFVSAGLGLLAAGVLLIIVALFIRRR